MIPLQIEIPMTPPRECSPNRRVFWRKRADATKLFKSAAYIAAKQMLQASPLKRDELARSREIAYTVLVSWEPGRRGAVDEDNVLASCKGALDGIAAALGVDDRIFRIRGVEIDRTTRRGVTIVALWPNGRELEN